VRAAADECCDCLTHQGKKAERIEMRVVDDQACIAF
jgi:hypothetical protein